MHSVSWVQVIVNTKTNGTVATGTYVQGPDGTLQLIPNEDANSVSSGGVSTRATSAKVSNKKELKFNLCNLAMTSLSKPTELSLSLTHLSQSPQHMIAAHDCNTGH